MTSSWQASGWARECLTPNLLKVLKNGYVFIDLVSKLKLERAEKSKQKMIKEIKRRQSGLKF